MGSLNHNRDGSNGGQLSSPSRSNPYKPVGGFLSNVSRFKIIESTLREGEQFANAFFDTDTKIKIARMLDDFGVDYIELTSPAASEQSRRDIEAICKLGLQAKILTRQYWLHQLSMLSDEQNFRKCEMPYGGCQISHRDRCRWLRSSHRNL
jgi:hypothetical protein